MREKLSEVVSFFISSTSFLPVMGAEIEFYLSSPPPNEFFDYYNSYKGKSPLLFAEIEKERGENQFEIRVIHCDHPILIAETINQAKKIITEAAEKFNLSASFASKPYADQPGNGLHIHISLQDSNKKNIFIKQLDHEENPILYYAIAGLLELLPASMRYFAPKPEDYARFIRKKCSESPTTISWGGNNRTVALRLPTSTLDPFNRRIEHRVPCANADPFNAMACVILGVAYGIINKITPKIEKIYGDAALEQYNLSPLPASLEESIAITHSYLMSHGY